MPKSKLKYSEKTSSFLFFFKRVKKVLDTEKTLENLKNLRLDELMFIYRDAKIYNVDNIKAFNKLLSKSSIQQVDYIKDSELNNLLIKATKAGDANIIKLLIEQGADPNAQDQDGDTPLRLATRENCPEIVKLLLKHNADPNIVANNGCAPLHMASSYGFIEIMEMLLSSGADITLQGWGGLTPLGQAAKHKQADAMKLLRINGAI